MSYGLETQWFKIFVEKQQIDGRIYLKDEVKTITNFNPFSVIQIATQFDWALLTCIFSDTELLISSGRISPFYKNTTEESYICFTKSPKDLVFGSSIDGTKVYYPGLDARNERNLLKGFYLGQHDQCCYYQTVDKPLWLLIDFGRPKTFTTVTITTLGIYSTFHFPKAGDIWISNSSTTAGDFSKFRRFSAFQDFTQSGQTMELKRKKPVTAQYVGIMLNSGEVLHICSVFVY